MVTSTSMIGAKKETLKRVFYIHYLVQFKKNTAEVQALIDSKSEVNEIVPTHVKKLGFQIRKNDIKVQKIDGSILEIYNMVIAGFQIQDKFKRTLFF